MKITNYERINMFKTELDLIGDINVRKVCEYGLINAPEYFFTIPASTTGKYHPKQDLGECGLVRHTKSVIHIGIDLVKSEVFVKDTQQSIDFCVICGLFHDIVKCGYEDSQYTKHEHPMLASMYLTKCVKELNLENDIPLDRYAHAISCHMGKWNTNKHSDIVLNKPETKYDYLLHTADYIASRKYVKMF